MRRLFTGAGVAAFLSILALAQSGKRFEVADIHPSAPGTKQADGGFMPGRLEIKGATMLDLISMAYDVDDDSSIVGGPGWLTVDRFDVLAKAPEKSTPETLQAMVKNLLADRFQLVVREEKREMPAFILTQNKKALKLQPAADKNAPPKTGRAEGDPAINNHVKCTSCTMEFLGGFLAQGARNFVSHPVVDETHLKDKYDFQLDWMGMGAYRQAKANPDGPPAFGIFDSLESLGLHLEEGKRPFPVLTVVSVNETPTPNPEGVSVAAPAFPTEFEVAEVRPAKPFTPPAGRGGAAAVPGAVGRFTIENGRIDVQYATLKWLLTTAYNLDPRMVVGGPKWLDEDRFDVIAKTGPAVPFEAVRTMMQKLLAERFKIQIHKEDQVMPVYVLEAGKKPNLKASDGTARSECKIVQADQRYYVCANTTMAQFVEQLPTVSAAYIHPPLLDLTGIKGAYDFKFYWTAKKFLQNSGDPGAQASTPVVEVTLFEAVDKQLGLKLEEQKHPVPVTVIDSAERPSAEK